MYGRGEDSSRSLDRNELRLPCSTIFSSEGVTVESFVEDLALDSEVMIETKMCVYTNSKLSSGCDYIALESGRGEDERGQAS